MATVLDLPIYPLVGLPESVTARFWEDECGVFLYDARQDLKAFVRLPATNSDFRDALADLGHKNVRPHRPPLLPKNVGRWHLVSEHIERVPLSPKPPCIVGELSLKDAEAGMVPLPPVKPPLREWTGTTTHPASAFPAAAMRGHASHEWRAP